MKKILLFLALGLILNSQTLFAQLPSYVPSNGLVGYWGFNGNASDQSGNSNNGTVNGATLTSDRFGNANSAYSFDGVSDYINVITNNSLNFQTNNKMTLSYWIKATSLSNSQGSLIINKQNGAGTSQDGWNSNIESNGSSSLRLQNGTSTIFCVAYSNVSSISISTNYHIVQVFDNGTSYIYINGILVTTAGGCQGLIGDNSSNLYIGKPTWLASNAKGFNGVIDDLGIWNRALTQQEITALYDGVPYSDTCNAVSGSLTNGLEGYWPFCGNANDDSGHGNNGTVNGTSLTTDRFGNPNSAFSFDGSSTISVANNASLNIQQPSGQITVSVWAYKTTDATGGHIIGKRTLCSSFQYQIGFNDKPYGIGWGGQNCYLENVLLVFPTYEWIHYVGTYDGNTWKLYKNATLVGSLTASLPPLVADDLIFGGSGTCTKFIGKIDDIGIWSRALTLQEITQLYNQNQCFTNISVTDTMIINVGQLSFTNPIYYANNITLYPNPANTQVNISFTNITDLTGGHINIINSLGQQVATAPITLSGTNTTLSLTTWGGAGLYFVQIINAQGQIVDIKKIILQ